MGTKFSIFQHNSLVILCFENVFSQNVVKSRQPHTGYYVNVSWSNIAECGDRKCHSNGQLAAQASTSSSEETSGTLSNNTQTMCCLHVLKQSVEGTSRTLKIFWGILIAYFSKIALFSCLFRGVLNRQNNYFQSSRERRDSKNNCTWVLRRKIWNMVGV